MKPLISCVTPTTKNREKFLGLVYRSFLNQTYQNIELILGSEDSIDYIPHPRIRFIETPAHISLGSKRNFINSHALGSYIVHFDSDEYSAPFRIDWALNLEPKRKLCGVENVILWDVPSGRAFGFKCKSNKGWVSGSSMFYERDHWCYNQFADVSIQEDTRFVTQTGPDNTTVGQNKMMVISFVHNTNTYRYNWAEKNKYDELNAQEVNDVIKPETARVCIPLFDTTDLNGAELEKRRLELFGYQTTIIRTSSDQDLTNTIPGFDYYLITHDEVIPWSGFELIRILKAHPECQEVGFNDKIVCDQLIFENLCRGESKYRVLAKVDTKPTSLV